MTSELTAAGIPVVLCNAEPAGKLREHLIEYEHGITKRIQHVVELGHRRSAVLPVPRQPHRSDHQEGSGVWAHGPRIEAGLCFGENYRVDAGASAVRKFVRVPKLPTVIFCGNDLIAMGAMSALEESGVRVPEDVSVIGIDDIFFAFLARPPLTTISVPREQLGVKAFESLDRMLNLKRHKGSNYMLETDLVVRKSTAPVRRLSLKINS